MKRFIVRKLVQVPQYFEYEGPAYKEILTNHKYLVVNVDEPYAKDVFHLIKVHEQAKGTWDGPDDFDKFVEQI